MASGRRVFALCQPVEDKDFEPFDGAAELTMTPGKIEIAILFGSFFASILIAAFVTWKLRNLAVAHGWVLGPQATRDVHSRPMPRLGGVAIYGAFLVSLFGVLVLCRLLLPNTVFAPESLLPILVPATMILLLGLYDDIRGVGPWTKICVQAIVGVLLYRLGFTAIHIPVHLAGLDITGPLNLLATVFWVLLISNAFNLIDGLDGLAAGSALFSVLTLLAVSLVVGNNQVAVVAVVLGGAILGFLRYNFNPATIFLGDSGSLFLGFMLSAMALAGAPTKSTTLIAVAIPLISFGLPLVETTVSIVRRFISGKPIFAADREHIHHKLLDLGWSHTRVVILLYGVSALCAVLSVLLLHRSNSLLVLVLFVLGTVFYLGMQKLNYQEFVEAKHAAQRTLEGRRIMESNVAVRKAAERLCRANTFEDIGEILSQGFEGESFDSYELTLEPFSRTSREPAVRKAWPQSAPSTAPRRPKWTLTIPVPPNKRIAFGQLVMHRGLSRGDLMIDVNVLIADLPRALSIACETALLSADPEHARRAAVQGSPGPMPPLVVANEHLPSKQGSFARGSSAN